MGTRAIQVWVKAELIWHLVWKILKSEARILMVFETNIFISVLFSGWVSQGYNTSLSEIVIINCNYDHNLTSNSFNCCNFPSLIPRLGAWNSWCAVPSDMTQGGAISCVWQQQVLLLLILIWDRQTWAQIDTASFVPFSPDNTNVFFTLNRIPWMPHVCQTFRI